MFHKDGRKYIPGAGSPTAKLMIVYDTPDFEDENRGSPFVGQKGRFLEEDLASVGCDIRDTYISPLIKVRSSNTSSEDIEYWLQELQREINTIKPNCILLLDRSQSSGGAVLLQALTTHRKIDDWRGSILRSLDGKTKIVPSFTPAALLYGKEKAPLPYKTRSIMRLDYARAFEESGSPTLNLPDRSLHICKSSGELERFIRNYAETEIPAIDIESMYGLPYCIGISFRPNIGLCVPIINLYDEWKLENYERGECLKIFAKLFSTRYVIGQNLKYDEGCLDDWGFYFLGLFMDTMLAGATLNPEFPKGLAFQTSIFTREPYYKDDLKEFDPKKDNIEQVYRYNARDACVTKEISIALEKELKEENLWDYYQAFVNPLHKLYLDIESRGFFVDEDMRKFLQKKYDDLDTEAAIILDKLNGNKPLNVNSPKQVKNFLYNILDLPARAGTDEDTLVQLLGNHAKKQEQSIGIEKVLDRRRIKKTKSTYINFTPDYDGRLRTSFNIVGTENGRSSTSVLDKPVRPQKLGLSFHTITKHGDIGADIRRMFLPHPGEVLAEVDLSQAEARIVAILSGDEELLHIFSSGQDVHKITAHWVTGMAMEKISDENGIRFLGKTFRHAGAYDMKKRRAMQTVNTDIRRFKIPIDPISEYRAGVYLDKFHAMSPKIRSVFHKEVRLVLETTRCLTNPFGWKRNFFDRMTDDLIKEGLACIPQSTVRGQMIRGMLDLKKIFSDLKILGEAHDSMVFSLKEKDITDVFTETKKLLERPINFAKCSLPRGELVIPCDFKIGENYKDLRKYKL